MERIAIQGRTTSLSPIEAWYTLTSSVFKTLEYPLAALTISKEDWDKIMVPVLQTYLPKAKFDRHLPRVILFNSTAQHGLGLLHPWYHQQCLHVMTFITHMRNPEKTLTGRFLRTSYEALIVESGLSVPFQVEYQRMNQAVSQMWMTNLWEFLSQHRIRIETSSLPTVSSSIQGDCELMSIFSSHFTGWQLYQLNMRRIYLKGFFLSDIVTSCGSAITQSAWIGKPAAVRHSIVEWPRQPPNIPSSWWSIWRVALRTTVCSHNRLLLTPLKGLTQPPMWPWYASTNTRSVFKREGHIWRRYTPRSNRPIRLGTTEYRKAELWRTPFPDDIQWITARQATATSVIVDIHVVQDMDSSGSSWSDDSSSTLPAGTSVTQLLRSTSTPVQQLCSHLIHPLDQWATKDINGSIGDLLAIGTTTHILAISDGSFKSGICTSSSVIYSERAQVFLYQYHRREPGRRFIIPGRGWRNYRPFATAIYVANGPTVLPFTSPISTYWSGWDDGG